MTRVVFAIPFLFCALPISAQSPEIQFNRLDSDHVLRKGFEVFVTPVGYGAQISPNHEKVVFSNADTKQIETAKLDGSGVSKLAEVDGQPVGTPRWSPDGKWVAFDVDWRTKGRVFVVSAAGGAPREVAADRADNVVPNWSLDGEWIYFASNRTGDWQVWKVAFGGGEPLQVTQNGGFAASESEDGKLYYAKNRYPDPDIWSVPVSGGAESPTSLKPGSWADWSVVTQGIYFVSGKAGQSTLQFLDFKTQAISDVATLDTLPFYLSVSRDSSVAVCDIWRHNTISSRSSR